jgi:hypothetical protein
MRHVVASIKWVMLVSGLLTGTMFYAVIAPGPALMSTFGAVLVGPLAEIVVRSWGTLIGLMGVMLVYGAFHEAVRPLVLATAGASKVVYVILVVSIGTDFLPWPAMIVVVSDTLQAMLLAACLIAVSRRPDPAAVRGARIL